MLTTSLLHKQCLQIPFDGYYFKKSGLENLFYHIAQTTVDILHVNEMGKVKKNHTILPNTLK